MADPRRVIVSKGAEGTLQFEVRGDGLVGRLDGGARWRPSSPLDEKDFCDHLEQLRLHLTSPIGCDEEAAGLAAGQAAWFEVATAVGERLAAMLSKSARARLEDIEAGARAGEPVLLRLSVAASSEEEVAYADQLLALPWELLRLRGRFPVEQHTFDLVREAYCRGQEGLTPPGQPLEVVAMAAAPIKLMPVDHEGELFRLWRALGTDHEACLRVADLGTLEELATLVQVHRPSVVHFIGHGMPGGLVFEDDLAMANPVKVEELIKRLRTEDSPLPRLVYLSACFGMNSRMVGHAVRGDDAQRVPVGAQPSTAAALHRGGFAQVVGYFGPVGDLQATRLAGCFYTRLAQGKTARSAMRAVRELATTPLERNGHRIYYPLGWAQIALYHRGGDHPTAFSTTTRPNFETPQDRVFVRLDQKGGIERVERRREGPLLGVQQLRKGFGFIGRRRARAQALRQWRSGGRVLVVVGLGGLGKTTLCAELLRLLRPPQVLALNGRFAGAQDDPIAGLWREVQDAFPRDLRSSLLLGNLQHSGLTPETLVKAIAVLAEACGGLIVYLDDAESLQEIPSPGARLGRWRNPQLYECWRRLVELAENDGPVDLVASSRFRPEGTPEAAILNLEEMSEWETLRLLTWMPTLRRLSYRDRIWLAPQVAGHPRTLELLEVLAASAERRLVPPGGQFKGDWRKEVLEPILAPVGQCVDGDLLLGQIWEALDQAVRDHLGRLTILTAPAPWAAILHLERRPETGRQLADAGLLSPFESPEADPWWAPHRLVVEAVRFRWKGDLAEAHRELGAFFARHIGDNKVGQFARRAVEHLCAGGDGNGAFPIARDLVISLREDGRYREALEWIGRPLAAGITCSRRGWSLTHRVQLLRRAGSLPEDGEAQLNEALDLVPPEERGSVLHELGALCRARGALEPAARYLQRALEAWAFSSGETSPEFAASLHELASVLQDQGEHAAARKHLEQALEIMVARYGTELHPSIAKSRHKLASVHRDLGELTAARRELERSLEIKAKIFSSEAHPQVAASMYLLGILFHDEGDLDAAKRNLERSLEIKETIFRTEDHPAVASSLYELARVLEAQDDLVLTAVKKREILAVSRAF